MYTGIKPNDDVLHESTEELHAFETFSCEQKLSHTKLLQSSEQESAHPSDDFAIETNKMVVATTTTTPTVIPTISTVFDFDDPVKPMLLCGENVISVFAAISSIWIANLVVHRRNLNTGALPSVPESEGRKRKRLSLKLQVLLSFSYLKYTTDVHNVQFSLYKINCSFHINSIYFANNVRVLR